MLLSRHLFKKLELKQRSGCLEMPQANVQVIADTFARFTASHNVGLEREFTWQELPKTFVAVTGLSMTDPTGYVTSSKPLTIPPTHAMNDTNEKQHNVDKDAGGPGSNYEHHRAAKTYGPIQQLC
jgi:hypothetical protein